MAPKANSPSAALPGTKRPFHVGLGNPAPAAAASPNAATSAGPSRPAYLVNRKAPRITADSAPPAPPPQPVPTTAGATDEDAMTPRRSSSPVKYTIVPCVAHPVYTKHLNCGCLRSRSGSPTHKDHEHAPRPKSLWDDVMPPVLERPPTPPPPPVVVEPPLKLGNVKGIKHLRHVAATGGLTLLATENNGNVVQARHSVTGLCLPDDDRRVAVPKSSPVPVTAMLKDQRDRVWCGHQDGTIRIYGPDGIIFEASKHSGAVQCFVAFDSDAVVYAGSADWYITRWTQVAPNQWRAATVGGHSLGVRALCEAITNAGVYLCSAADDGEIRVWQTAANAASVLGPASPKGPASPSATATPTMALKRHQGAVLCCAYVFDNLWTGGDDTTVRRWSLSERRVVAELSGHTSSVLSLQKVGNAVWTLGKDGLGILFDGATSEAVHTLSFCDAAPLAKASQRLAAQMFYVQPVTGHLLWISDPAGETAAWYAPAEEQAPAPAQRRNGDREPFEDSERIVELYYEADAKQRGHIETLRQLIDEQVSAVVACFDLVAERFAAGTCAPPPPPVEQPPQLAPPSTNFDVEELDALRAQLREARERLDQTNRDEEQESQAVNELRTIALTLQDENRLLVRQLEESQSKCSALETQLQSLLDATQGDQFTVGRRVGELERVIGDLRQELESKQVEIDALRTSLAKMEPSAELIALRKKIATMGKEREDIDAQMHKYKEAIAKYAEERAQLLMEISARDEHIMQIVKDKEEALAKFSRSDVDSHSALSNVKTDAARLQQQLQAVTQHADSLDRELAKTQQALETKERDVLRLQGLMADRDREEIAVRQSYEARIAELVARLKALSDPISDGKLQDLAAANADLQRKLGEFTSPRYNDLLNDNVELKRQLGEHRDHITRLLQHDQRLEGMVKDLKDRLGTAAREADAAAVRRSASPRPLPSDVHDPSNPHHRESCIWCSGAVNVSAGSTFTNRAYVHPHSPEAKSRSRSRSPNGALVVATGQVRGTSQQMADPRSVSAPPALDVQMDEGRRPIGSKPSESARGRPPPSATGRSSSADVAPEVVVGFFNADGSPRTVQRKKDRRVAQLREATESAPNEAVKNALINQILAIHKQVVGASPSASEPTPAAAAATDGSS